MKLTGIMNIKATKYLLILLALNFTGCSAKRLYIATIESERDEAFLEKKLIKLDYGDITYLENDVESDHAIVLLHGFGGDKDLWNRFSANLDKNKHIIVPDLPGHGKSVSSEQLDYSITHQAIMLDKFLTAKKIKKIHVVGNSMGGAIALKYTGLYSDKVNTLILIDALGMIKTKSEFEKTIDKTGENPFFNICTETAFNKLINFSMQKPPYIPGMMMNYLVEEKCKRAKIEKVVFKNMIQDSDLTHTAKKINTPTLILWGKLDRVLHIDNAALFHNTIKASQLIVFNELGHVPLLEDPAKTAQAVNKFIGQYQ